MRRRAHGHQRDLISIVRAAHAIFLQRGTREGEVLVNVAYAGRRPVIGAYRPRTIVRRVVASIMIVVFLLTGVIVSSSVALADDDCSPGDSNPVYKQFKKAACKGIHSSDGSDPLDKVMKNDPSKNDESLGVVSLIYNRMLNPAYYINSGVNAGDADSWKGHCAALDSPPTLSNNNCDVPGILTEAIQDVANVIEPSGIISGQKDVAKTPLGLGIATSLLPTDDVPAKAEDRTYKYTGLEDFGYNLQWVRYAGEWDYVKVYTEDRLKTSMGLGDAISLPFKSLWSGMKSGVGVYSDLVSKLSSGDYSGLAGSLLHANPFGSAAAAGDAMSYTFLSTVLNGYEQTVVKDGSWYRPEFANSTVYGARSLTDIEIAALSRVNVVDLWNQNIAGVLDKHGIDVDGLKRQSAAPAAPAKDVKKDKDGNTVKDKDGKDVTEYEPWSKWKSDNQKQIDWGKANLNVDAGKYDNSAGDALDKYNALKTEWSKAADSWVEAQSKAQEDQNMPSILSDMGTLIGGATSTLQQSASNPSSALYCADDENQPVGSASNAIVKSAVSKGLRDPGKEAFDADGNWACGGSPRPTIVGGLLGSAGDEQQKASKDTRRTAWGGFNIMDTLLWNKFDWLSQKILGASQWLAMLTNQLIAMSYQPILTQLGLKALTIKLVTAFKDTIYMNLLVLFIAIAALMILLRFTKGEWTASFGQIGGLVMTIGLGIIVLLSPSAIFTLVDDAPSMLERAGMATILQPSANDAVCSATGTAKGTISVGDYVDLFGKDTGFNPDSTARTMQCDVWKAFVLNPWAFGQFGTNIDNLYADGHAGEGDSGASDMKTSTDVRKIVGDAAVNMGDGKIVNNWGIYQLSHELSGSSTTVDATATNGVIDKDLYRLVDLQAGPDNAAGRTTKYFAAWKGSTASRMLVAIVALASNVMALIGLGGLALRKIEYTVLMCLFLMILPFMLLIGLLPGNSRMKLKSYGWEILGLALKRVFSVIILTVGIMVVLGGQTGDSDFFTQSLATMALAGVVMIYGPKLLGLMSSKVDEKAGSFHDYGKKAQDYAENNPYLAMVRDDSRSMAVGTVGAILGNAAAGRIFDPASSSHVADAYKLNLATRVRTTRNQAASDYQSAVDKADHDYRQHKTTAAEHDAAIAAARAARRSAMRSVASQATELHALNNGSLSAKVKLADDIRKAKTVSPAELAGMSPAERARITKLRGLAGGLDQGGSLAKSVAHSTKVLSNRANYMRHRKGLGIGSLDVMNDVRKEADQQKRDAAERLRDSGGEAMSDPTVIGSPSRSISEDLANGGASKDDITTILQSRSGDFRFVERALDPDASAADRARGRRELTEIVDGAALPDADKEKLKDNIALSAMKDDSETARRSAMKDALGSDFVKRTLRHREATKEANMRAVKNSRNSKIRSIQSSSLSDSAKQAAFAMAESTFKTKMTELNMNDSDWLSANYSSLESKRSAKIASDLASGKVKPATASEMRDRLAKGGAEVRRHGTIIKSIDDYAADRLPAAAAKKIKARIRAQRAADTDTLGVTRSATDAKNKATRAARSARRAAHDVHENVSSHLDGLL